MKSHISLVFIVFLGFSTRLLQPQVRSEKALETLFEGLKSSDLEVKNRASQGLLS